MAHRIKLGELLVRAGVLDETRLKAALSEQERWGGRLGSLLVSMGFIAEDILVKALSKQLAVPVAHLDAIDVPATVLEQIDLHFAKLNVLCPERFLSERRTLVVAMADPVDIETIDSMARQTGYRIQATVAGERSIMRSIATLYGEDAPALEIESAGADVAAEAEPSAPLAAITALEDAQKKQLKAIRAMAELLIEKGLISRDEYFTRLQRRGA